MKKTVEKIKNGNEREIARYISIVEMDSDGASSIIKEIFPYTGNALRIGITGPPGAGKSTLIDKLTLNLVQGEKSVGIIALDPVSPFSGGALLGDRVRMSDLNLENKVFIRSMALREGKGGISRFALDAADILDASGKDYIIVETVGIGQSEIEIAYFTDCTILVLSPESGDGIQAMKAGILEAVDLIVVNKSDRPGAEDLKRDILFAFGLSGKKIDVVLTNSLTGEGIQDVINSIEDFIENARKDGRFERRRKEIIKHRIKKIISSKIEEDITRKISGDNTLDKLTADVYNLKYSTYEAADEIIKKFLMEG